MDIGSETGGRRSGVMVWAARAAAAMTIAAGLTGCNNALKDENAALLQENAELREQRGQLEASLGSVESQRAALESEIQSLRESLASRGVGGDTGFGGDGVTVSSRNGEIVVGVAGDVLFDSGKVTIKSTAKNTLSGIASTIQQRYPGKTIRVEGYTDSDPIKKSGWKTNERLSAERALAVEEYLVSRGLRHDQVYSAAFGPADPKGTKRDSRRVEIVIVER
jgi:chemotaxis protein MotB